ncbi:uncharacterized protein BDV17DRAFT_74508 [Aspergillus undulatus]|uniref:uncharacterized protein n=1 Tax=Aspergillus undulatus TaxID=1810928 RepID=UPI003CCD2725
MSMSTYAEGEIEDLDFSQFWQRFTDSETPLFFDDSGLLEYSDNANTLSVLNCFTEILPDFVGEEHWALDHMPVDTFPNSAGLVASSRTFWTEFLASPPDDFISADLIQDIALSQAQEDKRLQEQLQEEQRLQQPIDTEARHQREQSVITISDNETICKTRRKDQKPQMSKIRSRRRRATRSRKSRADREAQHAGLRRSGRKRSQPDSYRTVIMFDFDEVVTLD